MRKNVTNNRQLTRKDRNKINKRYRKKTKQNNNDKTAASVRKEKHNEQQEGTTLDSTQSDISMQNPNKTSALTPSHANLFYEQVNDRETGTDRSHSNHRLPGESDNIKKGEIIMTQESTQSNQDRQDKASEISSRGEIIKLAGTGTHHLDQKSAGVDQEEKLSGKQFLPNNISHMNLSYTDKAGYKIPRSVWETQLNSCSRDKLSAIILEPGYSDDRFEFFCKACETHRNIVSVNLSNSPLVERQTESYYFSNYTSTHETRNLLKELVKFIKQHDELVSLCLKNTKISFDDARNLLGELKERNGKQPLEIDISGNLAESDKEFLKDHCVFFICEEIELDVWEIRDRLIISVGSLDKLGGPKKKLLERYKEKFKYFSQLSLRDFYNSTHTHGWPLLHLEFILYKPDELMDILNKIKLFDDDKFREVISNQNEEGDGLSSIISVYTNDAVTEKWLQILASKEDCYLDILDALQRHNHNGKSFFMNLVEHRSEKLCADFFNLLEKIFTKNKDKSQLRDILLIQDKNQESVLVHLLKKRSSDINQKFYTYIIETLSDNDIMEIYAQLQKGMLPLLPIMCINLESETYSVLKLKLKDKIGQDNLERLEDTPYQVSTNQLEHFRAVKTTTSQNQDKPKLVEANETGWFSYGLTNLFRPSDSSESVGSQHEHRRANSLSQ